MSLIKRAVKKYNQNGVSGLLNAIYKKSVSVELRAKMVKQRLKYINGYSAIGEPLRVYTAELRQINHICGDKDSGLLLVRDGDWDINGRKPVEETYRYHLFTKRFVENKDWEEIEEFKKKAKTVREQGYTGAIDLPREEQSVEVLREYYSYIEDLYRDIKQNGYKAQSDLNKGDDFAGRDMHPALNEIQVAIGRDGTIMVLSGYHRYTIAKILGLESIPVRTRIRHTKWQEHREEVAENPREFLHQNVNPDLKDLI